MPFIVISVLWFLLCIDHQNKSNKFKVSMIKICDQRTPRIYNAIFGLSKNINTMHLTILVLLN